MSHISHSIRAALGRRLTGAVVGAAVGVFVVTAAAPPATPMSAPVSAPVSATAAASASTAAAARLPRRKMTARLVQESATTVAIRGWVQRWPGRRVVIQRKRCLSSACAWQFHRVVRSGPASRYRSRIFAPVTGRLYWRAVVRRTRTFAWSYRQAWGYTYRSQ